MEEEEEGEEMEAKTEATTDTEVQVGVLATTTTITTLIPMEMDMVMTERMAMGQTMPKTIAMVMEMEMAIGITTKQMATAKMETTMPVPKIPKANHLTNAASATEPAIGNPTVVKKTTTPDPTDAELVARESTGRMSAAHAVKAMLVKQEETRSKKKEKQANAELLTVRTSPISSPITNSPTENVRFAV
jgi:hypothetical protein